ncbi:hypothetical protein PEP31012_00634 [Pandoraea eparura]|uniref:Uncharacterized protein n=1 Tax=Pandoraea eparura TaxID=2508291 RepID=A0A5E4S9X5_9BURK|nr:hypothetical protein PEP31012_00634 [Pandoraea eparura]
MKRSNSRLSLCQGSAQPTAERPGLYTGYATSRFGVGCADQRAAQPMPNMCVMLAAGSHFARPPARSG